MALVVEGEGRRKEGGGGGKEGPDGDPSGTVALCREGREEINGNKEEREEGRKEGREEWRHLRKRT